MDNNEFEKDVVSEEAAPDTIVNEAPEAEVSSVNEPEQVPAQEEKAEENAPAEEEDKVYHSKDVAISLYDENGKKKSKRQLKKEEKERLSKYHVSSWEIITHYRGYNEAEKKHYRYILGRRVSDKVWPIFRALIIFGLAFVVVYPILYMISCAIRPQSEMSDPSIMWIPKTFTLSNLEETWMAIDYPKLVWDTVSVNVVCSLIQVVTCAIAGYGFARFKFKGKGLMFAIVIMQIIVPTQVILIPQFMQFRYFDPLGLCSLFTGEAVNLADSPMALYLQAFFCNGIRSGLFIFLFRQFFRGLPKELEDAAYLDGCGPFETFVKVMVPNASNSFLTVFIFSVVWYWNDSYVSGMFFSKSNTIALQVSNLYNTISAYYNNGTPTGVPADWLVWIEAGCLLSILPILIMYVFLQKNFIEGVERSGIVG